ncbi:hypothetical protein STEG23_014068 [Scotinomys teguina]
MNQPPRCKHSARGKPAGEKTRESQHCPRASRVADASESVDALSGNRLSTTQAAADRAATRESAARVQGTAPGLAAETCTGDEARPAPRDPRLPTDRDLYPAPPHCPRDTPELPGSARQARAPAQSRRPWVLALTYPATPTPANHGRGGETDLVHSGRLRPQARTK